MIKLSPHFTLDELCRSDTAARHGIVNEPGFVERANLAFLTVHILEPARVQLGAPISVTSGYRCPALNAAVGGVKNSRHMEGLAADLQCKDMKTLFSILAKNKYVDTVLFERSGGKQWIHVQTCIRPRNSSSFNYIR